MDCTDLLQISPTQLDYVFVSNTELKQTLSLRNTLTDGRSVAFKIKTSAVSRYMVRPTVGIVPAGRSVNVRIYMVPQSQYSDELRSCKDRFLIQCVPTEAASVGNITSDTFTGNNRQDVKLHVSVVGFNKCPERCLRVLFSSNAIIPVHVAQVFYVWPAMPIHLSLGDRRRHGLSLTMFLVTSTHNIECQLHT